MSLEEAVRYLNRYLARDFTPEAAILRYVDVSDEGIGEYPLLAEAIEEKRGLPLVLVGDTVKAPPVFSFAWVVGELRTMGLVE